MGPRPHQRHVAANDIDELRQFIDARSPQHPADARHALVVAFGLNDRTAVFQHRHRPEFENEEFAIVEAATPLTEDYRPTTVEPDHERDREQKRKWRAAHPDQNRERKRKWCAAHPEKVAAKSKAQHAKRKGNGGSYTAKQWLQLKKTYGRCVGCGLSEAAIIALGRTLAADHVLPIAKGGSSNIDNIQPLCHGRGGCNNKKAARHIDYRRTA